MGEGAANSSGFFARLFQQCPYLSAPAGKLGLNSVPHRGAGVEREFVTIGEAMSQPDIVAGISNMRRITATSIGSLKRL